MRVVVRVLTLISTIALILFLYHTIYKVQYRASYREIELNEVARCTGVIINQPYWVSITTDEQFNNIKKKYVLEIEPIDFKKNMIVISYGAKLIKLDYNLMESTFKTRGFYIGFPLYAEREGNVAYIYKTQYVPIADVDVAGVPPNYIGEYR